MTEGVTDRSYLHGCPGDDARGCESRFNLHATADESESHGLTGRTGATEPGRSVDAQGGPSASEIRFDAQAFAHPGPDREVFVDPVFSMGLGDELTARDHAFLRRFTQLVARCFSDSALCLAQMSVQMAVSERALQRRLNALLGCAPTAFVRAYRLRRARELLRGGGQIAQVADQVGFNGHAYFASCFKSEFGLTPSEYRSGQLDLQRRPRGRMVPGETIPSALGN